MNKFAKTILCLSVFMLVSSSAWAGRVDWLAYDQGIKKAKVDKKPIFLYFYANWCGYCRKMESEAFADRTVANVLQDSFIPIMVNKDKQPRISARYWVRVVPFYWFLTENAELNQALPGYIPKDQFIKYLKFFGSSSYKKMSFEQFLQAGKATKTKK